MRQNDYEDRVCELETAIEKAQRALTYAIGSRASDRVIANRQAAMERACDAYMTYMTLPEHEEHNASLFQEV